MTDRNFTGQNQDLTTGSSGDLYDFMYREYHPIHGRWISPDPAGIGAVNPANPQSWNRYAYVERRSDETQGPQRSMPAVVRPPNRSSRGLRQRRPNGLPDEPRYLLVLAARQFVPQRRNVRLLDQAPTNGLANQGTIYDADLGAMQGGYYAAESAFRFWIIWQRTCTQDQAGACVAEQWRYGVRR